MSRIKGVDGHDVLTKRGVLQAADIGLFTTQGGACVVEGAAAQTLAAKRIFDQTRGVGAVKVGARNQYTSVIGRSFNQAVEQQQIGGSTGTHGIRIDLVAPFTAGDCFQS